MRLAAFRLPLCLSALVACLTATAASAAVTTETDTDRAGSDYSGYDLSSADPALCRKACEDDAQCKAYTYVKPGVQGPKARCYLKNTVPSASHNSCCVSGVKQAMIRMTPQTRTLKAKPSITMKPGVVAALAKPKDPGPLGKGRANGSLNGKPGSALPSCKKGGAANAIFDILDLVAKWFGGGVSTSAHCGNYERELAAGVTLGAPNPPPGQDPRWIDLGGSGDLMADSMLCLMKDIGDAPGGKITRKASADVAGIGFAVEQTVGLSKFEAADKRAKLYQQVRVCAPVVGCFDTQRQNITAQVKESAPAWPGNMSSGDYPVANSYSLDIAADWADSKFAASTPPITITTPYGSGTLQAKFDFFSSLYPVDTPFDYKKGVKLYFDHPASRSPGTTLAQDTYGRSGIPFILNVTTKHIAPTADCSDQPAGSICLQPPDPAPPPYAWSSQILFGARNGAFDSKPWNPGAGAKWPVRPDLDTDSPRSMLDRGPTANFVASAPVKIKPSVQELLDLVPPGVKSLIGGMGLEITVTPVFAADYAAQLGMLEREAKLDDCTGKGKEFGGPCGLAEALLYQQARAEGRMELKTNIHFWIDFNFSTPFYDPDIDFNQGFTVPIGGPDTSWDPAKAGKDNPYAHVARASLIAAAPAKPFGQIVNGFSGKTTNNIRQWTEQCLKTPPKHMSSLPDPTHQPGSPEDLTPDLMPCNICVADSNQNKYDPFVFPEVKAKSYSKAWTCSWEKNLGCHDLCTWHKTADGKAVFDVAVVSAVDVVGDRCATKKPPVVK